MADLRTAVNGFFASPGAEVPEDVLAELLHIIKLLSLSPEDLYYKWDSYVITMGADTTTLDHKTVRDFKKTLQDALERESRKVHSTVNTSRRPVATPKASSATDVFGMIDGMVSAPSASRSVGTTKRKANNFETPAPKSAKNGLNSSPADSKTPGAVSGLPAVAFEDRLNAGTVVESLNGHLPTAAPTDVPPAEARIKLRAAIDLPKFSYKPMAMKLSEASEILDDRIDTFTDQVQRHHQLPDGAFGNPAAQSTAEIVAVGRIACDTPNGKLNSASMVLETSRRMGAGMRVPLKFEGVGYDVFPGKIVALRGTNVGGEYFTATEVLPMPLLPLPASTSESVEIHNDRLTTADGESRPLNLLVASGPYTMDSDLSFAPLHTLLQKAETEKADALVLVGPFLDLEHPIVASGDFEDHLPADAKIEPDRATITDVFRALISQPIQRLVQAVPTITIVLVPSVRDAISKHVSWPQDRVPKPTLGLPKQVQFVANPMTLFINEMVVGISSQDVLSELRRGNVYQAGKGQSHDNDFLARLSSHVIGQSHFFPVYPPQDREDLSRPAGIVDEVPAAHEEPRLAMGANLDLTYLKLGEFWLVRPDVLILPSVLSPFAKVRNARGIFQSPC